MQAQALLFLRKCSARYYRKKKAFIPIKRDQGHSAVPPLLIINAFDYPLEIVNAECTPHFPCGTQGAGSKRFAEARINRLFSGDK